MVIEHPDNLATQTPLEDYWSRERVVTAKMLKAHTPLALALGAEVRCSCGWRGDTILNPNAWVTHLTDAMSS